MSTYLYGIVPASHPARVRDLVGVGKTPTPLRTVHAGELKAVVGDVPPDVRPKRRDLLAHERALESLCRQGPTLPMRFGVLAEDDDAVAREVSARQDGYLEILTSLAGQVEMNVKVAHRQEAVLREVLAADSRLRKLNEGLRAHGGTREERVRFGELVAEALSAREAEDAAAIRSALGRHATAEADGPAVDGCFVNTSFLVPEKGMETFEAAVRELAESIGRLAEVRTRGPLPPYSFADGVSRTA
ncbi:GvpL/GvpF family gas vesicle protein [Amycolatopsis nigrescens]|uniref:GvpL/GvpF family gas vesicle protein n=1 Tax=Amycolatopsis nigrescens TaxID=381445 RepID=UPI00036DB372|nr:GvpL/GvpF family gas vesicle protein [Amycolatopsis nigrescens]